MPTTPPSSPISAPCRLDWRPSCGLACALNLITVAALWAIWRSGVPVWLAVGLSAYAAVIGARTIWLLLRSSVRRLVVPWTDAAASVDGERVDALEVMWRGPMAVVSWAHPGGRRVRLHFWPDTLPAAQRRELRLAAQARAISSRRSLVAP
ncbi:hypothetical protein VDG07_17100 [Xanthomonas campestris pv. raphani]|uniref:hypothetical protein n=1 Tax=Xanthomonas campestris TaxID=339 RepID=UPI0023665A43|nr:hypothetical protein [Xanthomonas campestris]MEA9797024.1 hypothetical protein [Xanthomonas campestris pv. raphani]WDJ04313.1 hypothetical protein JH261_10335 [Xanthomonas campestris pv. incanae]